MTGVCPNCGVESSFTYWDFGSYQCAECESFCEVDEIEQWELPEPPDDDDVPFPG